MRNLTFSTKIFSEDYAFPKHLAFLSFHKVHIIARKDTLHKIILVEDTTNKPQASNACQKESTKTQLQPNHSKTDLQRAWAILQLSNR